MNKVVLIIQARMGSSRLPGKSMLELAGIPLIFQIFERVKRVTGVSDIVFATSKDHSDDIIEKSCIERGINVFRGSENNLVDRYYNCAKAHNADTILRLPADNPCPEPSEYDRIIDYHLASNNDFSSNICNFMGNEYPDGIGVEVFNFSVLQKLKKSNLNSEQKEHIALNFYDYLNDKLPYPPIFRVGTIKCPAHFSRTDINLDINTKEDYLFVRKLYEDLYSSKNNFSFLDVIKWYDKNM